MIDAVSFSILAIMAILPMLAIPHYSPSRIFGVLRLCLCLFLVPVAPCQQAPNYDLLIRNGRIIDGSGNPWYSGDIAIQGERIVAIGRLQGANARRVIDATGLVVSPGFIDMLGQSETSLLIDNRSLSKLSQGITSEITGEGGSIAPQNALTIAAVQPSLDPYKLKVDWSTLAEYFQRLETKGTPLNLG